MKFQINLLALAIIVFGCASESDVSPTSGGFIRYFSSENSSTAVLATESNGGITLLANVDVQTESGFTKKIKLIHTDINGNYLWDEVYPEGNGSMTASSFITLNSGYLIVGDSIKDNATEAARTDLLLLFVDENGKNPNIKTISMDTETDTTKALHGKAVHLDADGGFVVLARLEGDENHDMYLAKYSLESNSVQWERQYGAGASTLISRIFYQSDRFYWGGSVLVSDVNTYDFRIIRAGADSQMPLYGNYLGNNQINEYASDFCDAFGGWAFVGTTDRSGDTDIYYSRVSATADVISTHELRMDESNDEGNSICITNDNEIAVLGTVESGENQKDLYVARFDVQGNERWSYRFGAEDDQVGASMRALTDGSLLVFGTTTFGRARKLLLLKLSGDGTLN